MIYIDCPYNNGDEVIIKDCPDLIEQSEDNLDDSEFFVNKKSNPQFHTDWLNMIFPRILLSRDLLKENGLIFITIDENEMVNLRKICDEIFGKINYVGEVIRKTKTTTADKNTGFNLQHDYVLIYAKNIDKIYLNGEKKEFSNYKNPDNDSLGDWKSSDPSAKSGSDSTYFPIENPYTKKVDYPPEGRYWSFSKNTMKKYIESGKIKFKEEDDGHRGFIFKTYKNELKSLYNPVNSLFATTSDDDDEDKNPYLNEVGTKDARALFDKDLFKYPKPVILIKKLIKYSTNGNATILDFFSRSAATAQAVMELNEEEGTNNNFILVQIPKQIVQERANDKYAKDAINFLDGLDKPHFDVELSKERINLAGEKIIQNSENENLDIGFKVFKLDSSNFSLWQPNLDKEKPLESLYDALDSNINNILPGRNKFDILYEILIKEGLELSIPIKEIQENLFSINSGQYIVCLKDNVDENISNEIIDECNPDTCVIFLEKCFKSDDSLKSNIKEKLKYDIALFKTL
ncbi:site-specific DNA-methyltransferase [Methanobrevibacter sp.]|uniref:site-specific DNA-methyltransferase n=1 Tax=Methanobrevibacter sp. TaxID=66852 RepID=UPI0026DEB051|nr:site-specific DNA-methyltransferase [Methanobrevibacter sp.]